MKAARVQLKMFKVGKVKMECFDGADFQMFPDEVIAPDPLVPPLAVCISNTCIMLSNPVLISRYFATIDTCSSKRI